MMNYKSSRSITTIIHLQIFLDIISQSVLNIMLQSASMLQRSRSKIGHYK